MIKSNLTKIQLKLSKLEDLTQLSLVLQMYYAMLKLIMDVLVFLECHLKIKEVQGN